ncbi:MAG: hypothetical protein GY765_11795, partial [bacterium]|nr:hypothetical protein [bacterium]
MKMKKQRLFFNLWFVILLVQLLPAATATITVPGVSENLNSYLKGADVKAHDNCIYNLNELLLFEKLPTVGETKEALFKLYLRKLNRVNKITLHDVRRQHVIDLNQSFTYSLRSIFTHHSAIKDFLTRAASDPYAPVRFSLTKPAELQGAKYLLKLLGLTLFRSSTGEYGLHDASSPPNYENNRYYKITNIVWLRLQRALNKTGHLEFQLKEDKAELPESLEFFSTVTALPLTADNFLETLSQNRQLQLLLGMIYRLGKNEIAYISQLEPDLTAWKRIYHNGAFLSGMFFLSHSLRVEEGRIQLPGGGAAGAVWDTLAGTPHHPPSLDFLAQVATLDDGKLNYLYTFSFFLPTESRNALFNTNDPQRALALYRLVSLGRKEKLENLTLPSLHDQGFFTLMYALQTRDGKFFFPGGIAAWTKAVGAKENNVVSLLETLGKNQEKKNGIGCFMAVYSKFLQRHELMTPEVIETLYKNYGKYNVLVDFVEKIPFKNPDTVLKMFSWVKSLESTKGSDKKKESLTAILQSVLELLSRAARNNDAPVDYDGIVLQLTAIPFSAPEAYDGYFQFFENYLAYDPQEADDSFMEFALSGITNRPLTLHEQNYRLESFNFKKTGTVKIMKSQSVCSLSQLAQINRLLAEAATAPNPTTIQAIKTAFESLPQAELPPDAPLILRKSATSYSTKTLLKRVNKLTGKLEKKAEKKEILSLIREL